MAKADIEKTDMVKVKVPRAVGNEDPNLFISVNGVNYLLPKGKTSEVPRHIADEYYRSIKAEEELDATIDRLMENTKGGE